MDRFVGIVNPMKDAEFCEGKEFVIIRIERKKIGLSSEDGAKNLADARILLRGDIENQRLQSLSVGEGNQQSCWKIFWIRNLF